MTQATAKATTLTIANEPIYGRAGEVRAKPVAAGADENYTFDVVYSAGAAVRRYDYARERFYMEVLEATPEAINTSRLERGAPFLNSHWSWSIQDQIGVCENPRFENGAAVCTVRMSRRADVLPIVGDIKDGITKNISVGYSREQIEMHPPAAEGGMWEYRITRWTPHENSLVPIPADMDAQVRSASGQAGAKAPEIAGRELPTHPCQYIEIRREQALAAMPTAGVADTPETRTMNTLNTEAQAAAPAAAPGAAATQAGDANRAAALVDYCNRHQRPELAADAIRQGLTVEQVAVKILDERAAAQPQTTPNIRTVRDEGDTILRGVQEAIAHRVMPTAELTDAGRQFRGLSLLEMGSELMRVHGVQANGSSKLERASAILNFRAPLVQRSAAGMHGAGDFSTLLQNIATKRLRTAYQKNPGSYSLWARRAPNAPDFKTQSVVQMSGAPDLQLINEHGEFKYGTASDGAETYALATYGRAIAFTRVAMINDDLRGFDRMVANFGGAAARVENRTVYAQLTANAAMSDTNALFSTAHLNNQTGGGSALSLASLKAARTAMRLQKGLQNEELNIAPAWLIVPAALEQDAYQFTSSQFVPATAGGVNEFRAGGRTALTPVVEPVLDATSSTAWYLAANNGQVDTVEYCYLDGFDGPRIESGVDMDVDGIKFRAALDFAAKAIDWRGLNRAVGV